MKIEMPEGWKRFNDGAKLLKANGNGDNFLEAADLMKEMAEAVQNCVDSMNESSAPDSYGVQYLEVPLQKFKEWK